MRIIDIVVPVHNESGNIRILFDRLEKTIQSNSDIVFKYIFVNDGSKDNSLVELVELSQENSRVTVIDLSRNFGHQIAVTAGLDATEGDAVIVMDADLQDPPEVTLDLIQAWENGADVAYAQRRSRKDGFLKKATAKIFYRFLQMLSDVPIPKDTGDFRLLDKKVVKELNGMREHSRYIRGMVAYVGFNQVAVAFDRDERLYGKSNYPLTKMLKLATDGILSFSNAPLRLISNLGYLFSTLALAGIIYALVSKLIVPTTVVEGWTFMVIAVLGVGGIQLIMLGVLGSYIGRIYTEVQARPLYVINRIIKNSEVRSGKN
ncbi:MAG: glycosyltransferase family 2 protein [Microbacteriaceae bacterium]|nr:glycosyltransferase family 2 protein [Microbacteriaceae bacterium]